MEGVRIPVDEAVIAEFCRRWGVREFALFGSVLGQDFRPDSDVDVLVTFETGREWTLDEYLAMVDELKGLFGREVDLAVRSTIRNPFRRHHILRTRRIVHVA
ncbi:MAG: nucleotidyltransferase family protein [Planctomycetota bacterium]